MKQSSLQRVTQDLRALQRFIRGCQPGFGNAFSGMLMADLRDACAEDEKWSSRIEDLQGAVQNFVTTRSCSLQESDALLGNVEQTIRKLEESLSGEEHLAVLGVVDQPM